MAQEKSKTKTNKKIFFLAVILVAFLAALISMEYGQTVTNGKYTSNIKTIKDFTYDAGNKADFTIWENHIYYSTKDGIQYTDSSGETLWSETYNMTLPYMVQNESIIGVSEQSGRTLIIYDTNGKKYSVQTNDPILSFSVNSKGYSSVITSSESEYQLEVHNSDGVVIFSGHFQMTHGIPVSSSISNGGDILAVGFLNISDIEVSSRVSFYDINAESSKGSETGSSVFASSDEEGAVCGIVNFLDNNSAAIISDKSITFVYANPDTTEKYKEKNKIEFKNQIKQVAFDRNANVYASFGEKMINSGEGALENGTTICYDKDGNQKFSVFSEKKVTGIYPSEDSVLIGMDKSFKNYDLSGNLIWEYNTGQDTKKLLLINNDDLVLFVGTNKASVFRLTDEVLQNRQFYDPDEEEKEEQTEEEITKAVLQTETESEETITETKARRQKQENKNTQNSNTQNTNTQNKNTQNKNTQNQNTQNTNTQNKNTQNQNTGTASNADNNTPSQNPADAKSVEIDPSVLDSDNNTNNTDNNNAGSINNANTVNTPNTANKTDTPNTANNTSDVKTQTPPESNAAANPSQGQTPPNENPVSPNPDT